MTFNNLSVVFFLIFGSILSIIGLVTYSNIYEQYGDFSIERKHIKAQLTTSYGIGLLVISCIAIYNM